MSEETIKEKKKVKNVYSLSGIPNDAEKGMIWTLYLVRSRATTEDLLTVDKGT